MWNSWLDFGVQSWIWFTLKVYVHNETTHNVELLCNSTTHPINYTNSLKHVKMSCLDDYIFSMTITFGMLVIQQHLHKPITN